MEEFTSGTIDLSDVIFGPSCSAPFDIIASLGEDFGIESKGIIASLGEDSGIESKEFPSSGSSLSYRRFGVAIRDVEKETLEGLSKDLKLTMEAHGANTLYNLTCFSATNLNTGLPVHKFTFYLKVA